MPKPNFKRMGKQQKQVYQLLKGNPGYYIQVTSVDYPRQDLILFKDEDDNDINEIIPRFSAKDLNGLWRRNLLLCFQNLRMSVSTSVVKYRLKPFLYEPEQQQPV